MKTKTFAAMILLGTIACGCAEKSQEKPATLQPAIDTNNMDLSIKPGDDFFRYTNNKWLKNTPIPEEYTTFGAFTEIDQRNEVIIQDIIKEVSNSSDAPQGSVAQKIRDFYNTGMDTVAINERGYSELLPYFDSIDRLNSKAEIAALLGRFHALSFGGLFNAGPSPDPKQADRVIMHLYQGGLSLPDRDDYFGDDEKSVEMHERYQAHVANMFQLVGVEASAAQAKAESIFAFEKHLAEKSLTRVERRDPDRTYNKMTFAELQQLCPAFDWTAYFAHAEAPAFDSLNVGMPDFVSGLNQTLAETDLNTIKDYLKWKVLTGSASQLSSDLDTENFKFYATYLYGQESQQPRWRRILNATSGCLGEAIGQLYVEKCFPAEAKERMVQLVANLKTALGGRIENLDWMTEQTKTLALSKLEKINVKVGYPDKWKDYTDYEVGTKSYFENIRNASLFENRREMAKLGKPVDKDEWFMTPQTVNAYYSPEYNEIVFPAGILQPPFFNQNADGAVNYGGIGVVIGHEMTHGFDDQGRKYDEKGNLNDWWTEEDATQFNQRTQRLVELFNTFQVRGFNINGELTLGENIADLGGLNIAWDAYQLTEEAQRNEPIDNFTPAQRFFISYGTIWRNNIRDKALERRIKEDVHSPAEARVNRTLFSMPHFYEAFEIHPDDKLYIAPEERANIW